MLGQGTFGQVFKCTAQDDINETNNSPSPSGTVAVKVIKNQAAYYHQARVEIGILQFLNTRGDPSDESHIVRLKDFFLHKNHLCLVFELLNLNLFELIRHNRFRGLSLPLVRVFVSQILKALAALKRCNIIHCDIKPENVLLADATSGEVKLIDFGSACFSSRTVYTYIQSRFYRSPEVVLGHKYTMSIDMWSLGCVAAELFLGLPLFPAACELDLLRRIIETRGTLPEYLLKQSKNTPKFFNTTSVEVPSTRPIPLSTSRDSYQNLMRLKTPEEFFKSTGQTAPHGKQYFQHKVLADIITAYPFRQGLNETEIRHECARRESFIDFLSGLLNVDPMSRWTPRQAQMHPFITGSTFTGPFQPIQDPVSSPTANEDVNVSVSAVQGIPIGIPQTEIHTAAAAAVATTPAPAMATTPSALDSIAAAVVASSPQMHAQAHAAAMAAVQMQMNMQQQQQQQGRSIPIHSSRGVDSGAGGASSSSPYVAAHSLQRIMDPPLGTPSSSGFLAAKAKSSEGGESISSQWRAGSFPGGGGGGGGRGQSYNNSSLLNTPAEMSLLSPPSRSFGVHLQSMAADQQLPPPSYDPGYSTSPHRIMPLMHLPSGGGKEQPDESPIPFQPSSVSTYRSTLAATAAAAGAGSMGPSTQQQQQRYNTSTAVAAAAAARREPLQRTAGFVVPGDTSNGEDSSDNLPKAMSIPIESDYTPIAPADLSALVDDGEEASPPEKQQLENEEEELPNPDADWDPLWTDDVLTEEESFEHNRSTSKNIETSPFASGEKAAGRIPSTLPKDSNLTLAAQHLTQLQPLTSLGGGSASWPTGAVGVHGVDNAALEGEAAGGTGKEPCSPCSLHGSLMQGVSTAENMMWSPPRAAVATVLKSLPDGGIIAPATGDLPPPPPLHQEPPPPASQLEPIQRLHGFVVSTDHKEENEKKDGDAT